MKRQRVIVWFRQDLRIHDNEALTDALKSGEEVIPIYVFDDRVFKSKSRFGFTKTGKYRTKFIIESVKDLRESLRRLGSELIVRQGLPEEEIFELAREVKTSWVFCNRERTRDEIVVQDALESNLWSVGQEIIYSRGKMLYYTQDLPFPVTHTPDVFSTFRKEVEKFVQVREPLPTPTEPLNPWTVDIDPGDIPSLNDLGHEEFEYDSRSVIQFKGGETAGLERLNYYIETSGLIRNYYETRNDLVGGDYSSKFSTWLAQGCLSPKMIYQSLKRHEEAQGSNKSTHRLFLELLWRDFFRLMGKKHGNKIFISGGIKGSPRKDLKKDRRLLQLWIEGRTGVPFIDANMRELEYSGFMSNRGRQNVASFLVNDLKVNWQMGAEYFEEMLIDYDPCSNWGNWNYIAGVGSDTREDRYFNILSQARRYDPQGDYVKQWLPELKEVPQDKIHCLEKLSVEEQQAIHIRIGADYPRSMINPARWA
ncbi:MAG: DASH family cryptochrome [Bacteroidota bacterium]